VAEEMRRGDGLRKRKIGESGWGLGFRYPVRGLTGPNNQIGPYPKPAHTYGYSYRHAEVSD
jgi:hypothetical protein